MEKVEHNHETRRKPSLERYRPGARSNGPPSSGDDVQLQGKAFKNLDWASEVNDEEERERNEVINRTNNRRGGGGGGGGGARGGRGRGGFRGGGNRGHWSSRNNDQNPAGVEELNKQMGEVKLESNDLRHRLNQRSRDPVPLSNDDAQTNSHNGSQTSEHQHIDRRQHRRIQGRGAAAGNKFARPKKNTENFNPSHAPPDIRVKVADFGLSKFNQEVTSRDVIVVSDLFCKRDDLTIYEGLLAELKAADGDGEKLWQSWHGDSHLIADDKIKWKEICPTFGMVIGKIRDYFDMDIKATRLNWYRDSSEWKPFHHDAAAVKPDKAKTQNFTVAVSFGLEREAAFEHAKTRTVISMPQPNGMIYTFGKDVNVIWRHGILQMPPEKFQQQGRISIIAWGWIKQTDE